nr:uncharacterized protein LOC111413192 isoform X1 [Onthophagus taurus]XP_022904398.1 uncharacterized protein LOC111416573 isoform X1 [Onthophagus taurus]XP_022908692.1 uncharacterized protein LOC111420023 isoform X1 [Onthophagus taurus]XP_022910407.1 uncharacterized protein LOC111421476 isoform X1 [Onthophagus taurus]
MPRLFSTEEYADIHFIYGFCDGNAEAASREYARRFPNRRCPDPQVFINTHQRFRQYGLNTQQVRNNQNNRNQRAILNLFDNDSTLSSRIAARLLQAQNLRVSRSTILRTLKKDHRKPYRFQPVQNLRPEDGPKRVTFCRWFVQSVERDQNFCKKILWTDEATFTRRGVVNYHNLHSWEHENPHAIRPKTYQTEFSFNVWMGVINNNLCGPYFLNFLQNDLAECLSDVPLGDLEQHWLQMDGAPSHYSANVRAWCNARYGHRRIGRLGPVNYQEANRGPVAWPPRSPDLNVLDFFVWGYMKNLVYAAPINTREELLGKIKDAANTLRNNPFQILAAVNSVVTRCQKCIDNNGMHFEQFLN